MKYFSLLVFVFSGFLLANEISVFGAGDLESPDPYGLTSVEKAALKNKKKLNQFDLKMDNTRSTVDSLSQRIDGIESIVESDSLKLNNNVLEMKKISQDTQTYNEDIQALKLINEQNLKIQEVQNQNIKKLQKNIAELTKVVNKINENYVSRKRYDELVQFVNKAPAKVKKSTKKIKSTKKYKKSNKAVFQEAVRFYKKDYFTKAIPMFKHLIKKNYKSASSNFYLGEMWFRRKKHKDAIHYYKASMMLYDKAKYIPTLLLHSANSFEKINDLDNAANFYGTLIDVYPDTKEAKIAQKNLENSN
jgi:TolA-binding protein